MSIEKLHRETEEWRAAVGMGIIGFGELELITYKCLVLIPSDKISKTSSRLDFARRVDLIVEILEGRAPLAEVVVRFVQMLKRAKELANTRNDIAHNPVMLNVFLDEISGDMALEHSIETVRGDRSIDLASAKDFADEVGNLASEMWNQMGKIREWPEAGQV